MLCLGTLSEKFRCSDFQRPTLLGNFTSKSPVLWLCFVKSCSVLSTIFSGNFSVGKMLEPCSPGQGLPLGHRRLLWVNNKYGYGMQCTICTDHHRHLFKRILYIRSKYWCQGNLRHLPANLWLSHLFILVYGSNSSQTWLSPICCQCVGC